jgi:NAD(P)-dependent dehydrogenase (short-subunit alcohol dehydrogenase family)
VEKLAEDVPTMVGIDHGFSLPLRYFEVNYLKPEWPVFLDDFQHHWPTDQDHIYVDFVRDGSVGNGTARTGSSRWRRLTEERAGGTAEAIQGDVSQVATAAPLVAETIRRIGRLEVLVNNAAINAGIAFDAVTEAEFERMVATNMKSVLMTMPRLMALVALLAALVTGEALFLSAAVGAALGGEAVNQRWLRRRAKRT